MFELNATLAGRSLLNIRSLSDEELAYMVDLAMALKARRKSGIRRELLHRKNIALIFEKNSTRTRNSASIAVCDEGGHAEYLTRSQLNIGKCTVYFYDFDKTNVVSGWCSKNDRRNSYSHPEECK